MLRFGWCAKETPSKAACRSCDGGAFGPAILLLGYQPPLQRVLTHVKWIVIRNWVGRRQLNASHLAGDRKLRPEIDKIPEFIANSQSILCITFSSTVAFSAFLVSETLVTGQ